MNDFSCILLKIHANRLPSRGITGIRLDRILENIKNTHVTEHHYHLSTHVARKCIDICCRMFGNVRYSLRTKHFVVSRHFNALSCRDIYTIYVHVYYIGLVDAQE